MKKNNLKNILKSFLSDQNYYKELGQKYPELFKVVLNEYRKNFDYVIEILKYFRQDKEYIKGLIEKEDKIVSMELGKGDSHNNGRKRNEKLNWVIGILYIINQETLKLISYIMI